MSQSDAVSSSSSEPSDKPTSTHSSSGQLRKYVLFGLLLLMLIALWYDRKVARPGVESAYDRVERLNEEVNAQVGHSAMTNKEVQAELKSAPSRVITVGGYQVEVYSWRAGLPIKTRDYYAVFSSVSPNRFLKHYKFELPTEELTGDAAFLAPANSSPPDPSTTVNQTFDAQISERPNADRNRPKDSPEKEGTASDPAAGQAGNAGKDPNN